MKKAKKKPELWFSSDEDDSYYELWSMEPVWKPRRKEFWGSKNKLTRGFLKSFCARDFEAACPHLKLKGGEKAPITITMGKIVRAGK